MTATTSGSNAPGQHFAWVDNAKTLLIFLVVFGHLDMVPAKSLIYSFHVPAFLFITGFLLPVDFGRTTASAVLHRWVAVYLRAYILFSAASIAVWWGGASLSAGHVIDVTPAIRGTLYGVGGDDGGLVHENAPLWYFPFLVASLVGAWLCLRLPVAAGWALAVAWATFAVQYNGPRLPWCLDVAGVGVLVTVAGYNVRQHWFRIAPWLASRRQALMVAVGFGLLLVVLSRLNGPTNLNRDRFGHSGILFVLAMAAGIAMTVAICSLDQPGRLRRAVSHETLTIFAIHIYLVHRVNVLLPGDGSAPVRLLMGLGVTVAVLLISLGVALVLKPLIERLIVRRPHRA